MTEPAGVTGPDHDLSSENVSSPDHVVHAKSVLRPEALKPTFTGFHVVARIGSLFHVARAAPVDAAVNEVRRPTVVRPAGAVTHREDVDVALRAR
jgi:hypothetical protein